MTADALILAGGRIGGAFARAVGTELKGFIEVGGRPAIHYVFDALDEAEGIGRVGLVGPRAYADDLGGRLDAHVEEGANIGANLRLGAEALGISEGALFVVTCEAVCLSGEAIDEFLAMCRPELDIVYPIVSLEAVEEEFPERRWKRVPLRGQKIVATNMFLIKPGVLVENEVLVASIGDARKSVLKLARIWGLGFLVKLALHRQTLESIADHVERVAGVRGGAVMHPRAEVAMDLDEAVDIPIVEAWFDRRQF